VLQPPVRLPSGNQLGSHVRGAETHRQGLDGAVRVDPPELVAVAIAGAAAAYSLPREGFVTIGRGHEAMFQVDDRSVSRLHAVLHITPELAVEDSGSTNGTQVSGRRLEPGRRVPVRVGDSIELGSVTVVLLPCTWLQEPPGSAPRPQGKPAPRPPCEPIVADPAMLRLHGLASRAAATDISVLLLGETGCGKEVFAEAIHRHSSRHGRPFLRLHCAAVPEHLLESELFGHEKGAFTGAAAAKPGLLEDADGGTIFLDEVGDMPLPVQAKLLRVLEDRKVGRLGSLRARTIDVRFVAATNRNLAEDMRRGGFRADLYYRLNGFCIEIPPLRARPAEIAPLAQLFLRRAARTPCPPRLTPEAIERLEQHVWPGNVRELRHAMERALILAGDAGEITVAELPLEGAPPVVVTAAAPADERERIVDALARCAGNQSAAARLLGISRKVLIKRVQVLGLPRPHGKR